MKKVLISFLIIIMIAVLAVMFGRTYLAKYSYSKEMTDLDAYYGVSGPDL